MPNRVFIHKGWRCDYAKPLQTKTETIKYSDCVKPTVPWSERESCNWKKH